MMFCTISQKQTLGIILTIGTFACGGRDHGDKGGQRTEDKGSSTSTPSPTPSADGTSGNTQQSPGDKNAAAGVADSRIYGTWTVNGDESNTASPADTQISFKIERERFTMIGEVLLNGKSYCRSRASTTNFSVNATEIRVNQEVEGKEEGENSGCNLTMKKAVLGYQVISDNQLKLSVQGEEKLLTRQN